MSNPVHSRCRQETWTQPAEACDESNPLWCEGREAGRQAGRQSTPDMSKGWVFCHGWFTGNLESRGLPTFRKFTVGTIH
jgi:hypothetical protein